MRVAMPGEALRAEAKRLETVWKNAAKASSYGDQWGAYRAHERGETWPANLEAAHSAYAAALHAFYSWRDGPRGFLGGRGG